MEPFVLGWRCLGKSKSEPRTHRFSGIWESADMAHSPFLKDNRIPSVLEVYELGMLNENAF